MSRIGKKPVVVPTGVTVSVDGNSVTAKGPKGELSLSFEPEFVSVSQEENEVVVTRANDEKVSRARHGLYRSLLNNIVEGVSTGFSKRMEIRGVGYRGSMKGRTLELHLGFSHLVNYEVPAGVDVVFDDKSQTVFTVSGADKQLVGEVAANIRSYRSPEPYKGKGIRYEDEYVAMKAGKSGKA